MSNSKLKVIYTPEGGSKREWIVDMGNPAWDIHSQTEKATGWPWNEFQSRLANGSGLAVQALLWVLRRRTERNLQLESVVPADPTRSIVDDIDFEEVEDEPKPKAKKSKGEDESGEA